MASQVFVLPLVSFFILFLVLLWHLGWLSLQPFPAQAGKRRSLVHRLLKPRTPRDCPVCRLASPDAKPASAPVQPWREVKSRRGAPKRIPTDGFACPNHQCAYFGITDASIHALVGDGRHGHAERIQTFRCQACRSTFSARRNTPLYLLKTPSHQIAVVLSAASRRARPFRRRTGLRLPTSHHRHLVDSSWSARADLARALLLLPPDPPPPTGRTENQAPECQAGVVALASH